VLCCSFAENGKKKVTINYLASVCRNVETECIKDIE
jgi:hypothetical protein